MRTQLARARRPAKAKAAKPKEQVVAITSEYITLGQVLQAAGVVGSGGEAKFFLSEGAVQVNGDTETRRGRKLRPGDVVTAPDIAPIRIAADSNRADDNADTDEDDTGGKHGTDGNAVSTGAAVHAPTNADAAGDTETDRGAEDEKDEDGS